jgi:transcriptional regulator with XRE-family HTH domain
MRYLKELRLKKGVSQQVVADYLGVTNQAYSNYETGKREADYETQLKLAEYFEVSLDYLFRGSDADRAVKGEAPATAEADGFSFEAALSDLLVRQGYAGGIDGLSQEDRDYLAHVIGLLLARFKRGQD